MAPDLRLGNSTALGPVKIIKYRRFGGAGGGDNLKKNSQMKIGIDIRTLMDARYSGVSIYTLNLIREILKLDRKNEFKLFYNSGRDVRSRLPDFTYTNAKIISCGYPNKIFNYIMQKGLGWPRIDKILGGVDVFWQPHINFISLSSACRKVLTIHDLSFLRYPEFFNLRKNLWHYIINAKKLVSGFDKIIAVSENTKKDIIELCEVDKAKIAVIYSGVEERYKLRDISSEESGKIRKKYGLPARFILYLGNLEPRKNINGIIKAYERLREGHKYLNNVKLVIAGHRSWKSGSIIKEREKSKYKDSINFLGYIGSQDKIVLYRLAEIFVFPSFYEGFGFPALEAMASGTPLVLSYASSLPEITNKSGIYVNPYNTKEIAEAMARILEDNNLRDNYIKAGKAQADIFSWQSAAKEYLKILKLLAN